MSSLIPRPSGTANRTTRILGVAALLTAAFTAWVGLIESPPDVVQGNLVRLIYVHPAAATACYLAFGLCALSSLAYLWPRTRSRRWDLLAGASAEVGVVFCVLTLVTGSIWGRGSWGVWWTWDARLTLTALLLALFLGYLALRRSGGDGESRAKRSAVAAVCFSVVVPIDHYATSWWVTLHQGDTLVRVDPLIHGWQLLGMIASFLADGLILAWLLVHRYRLEQLEDRFETIGFAAAISQRRAEGAAVLPGTSVSSAGPAGDGSTIRGVSPGIPGSAVSPSSEAR
jgi:heme exporter protein C